MDFGKLASLSIGLAGFLGGLYIVLQIIKSLRRNGNGKKNSGSLDPAEWEQRIGKVVEEKLRGNSAQRNQEIRQIIREELDRK